MIYLAPYLPARWYFPVGGRDLAILEGASPSEVIPVSRFSQTLSLVAVLRPVIGWSQFAYG